MDRLEDFRHFFADLIMANAAVRKRDTSLWAAFASTPRERFVGPGPWKAFTPMGYITTPSDDPAFLYQDSTVALVPERLINNGQPLLHAYCLAARNVRSLRRNAQLGDTCWCAAKGWLSTAST
jgi:protein-L-isoaspartate(D-aspartate) O-methyltransferase